ncbi:MAG TPA: hypothetical protein VNC84_03160 [Gammaproteobacteria bacterium]|jgi:FimV-like protein|nr:hypothetical protein [Gammaproteobacteria bacterium]
MIYLIIKSYIDILLPTMLVSLFFLIMGLYFIFRAPSTLKRAAPKAVPVKPTIAAKKAKTREQAPAEVVAPPASGLNASDFSAISGDDNVLLTQLDLARAYIEAGQSALAKSILDAVKGQGSAEEQQEINHLLSLV